MTIGELIKSYDNKISYFDLEIIIAHSLGKTREFVLAHPEHKITKHKAQSTNKLLKRRLSGEPVAYITGHKEFYGLDFVVNKNTLIPRPETELLVELALAESNVKRQTSNVAIMDVGTGSGNIIISLAKNIRTENSFFATDISPKALTVAKRNAKTHSVDNKIKFLKGNLLAPLIGNWKLNPPAGGGTSGMIILANLPYLSKEIYQAAPVDVKKYEPKSALYSAESGLAHYRKLLEQIASLVTGHGLWVTGFFEISPEQKKPLAKIARGILPAAKIGFEKDLAGKWRVCKIAIQ